MKKTSPLLFGVLLACVLIACQPTPEEDVAAKRSDGLLEQKNAPAAGGGQGNGRQGALVNMKLFIGL